MKKEYINPVLEVVKIEYNHFLASSPELGGEYGGGQVLSPSFDPEPEPNMFGF